MSHLGNMFYFTEVMNAALANHYIRKYFFNYIKNKTLKMTKGLYPAPIQIAEVRTDYKYCYFTLFYSGIERNEMLPVRYIGLLLTGFSSELE